MYCAAGDAPFKILVVGTSLAVQWLRLQASTAGGMGSISGLGIKIPHAAGCSQKKKKFFFWLCIYVYSLYVTIVFIFSIFSFLWIACVWGNYKVKNKEQSCLKEKNFQVDSLCKIHRMKYEVNYSRYCWSSVINHEP